jgi:hypothetical protein
MSMHGGSAALVAVPGSRQLIATRDRFAVVLTDTRAYKQIVPSIVSAPPHERGT